MVDSQQDELTAMLAEGWEIVGYSNTMMAAGAMTFSVLLRKQNQLSAFTVIQHGDKELGRSIKVLAPVSPQKKAFRI